LPNGATHAANYKTQDFSEVVKQITNGHGVDVVIDFVGRTHFNKNLDTLATDGRMTMLALLSGKDIDALAVTFALKWDSYREHRGVCQFGTIAVQEATYRRLDFAFPIDKVPGRFNCSVSTYLDTTRRTSSLMVP
jgi:threonine dehydrogenase-like Zn-dependent dehydrogenase